MPDEPRDLAPIEQTVPATPPIEDLLPSSTPNGLTSEEAARVQQFQAALVKIGQAAGGALVCPGNQIGVADYNRCPYAAKCELLRLEKAPAGQLCPIERELVIARFRGWCTTIAADPDNLREDQRAVVAELTWIDIQEQRCTNILSRGEHARLTQVNVKDSNPETGEWLAWERVIHSNAALLESLHTRRRMIMREWLLTPEQQFKVAKATGKLGSGDDVSRRLSSRADKMRNLVIDVPYEDLPPPK